MLQEKMFQTEWQGLHFEDLGIEISRNQLPDSKFYSKFYNALCEKYSSYEQLEKKWVSQKVNTATSLMEYCRPGSNILGYGCGIGLIEQLMAFCLPSSSVHGYDFASNFSHFLETSPAKDLENLRLFSGSEDPLVESSKQYDVIFACQLLYALKVDDIEDLLANISSNLAIGGEFIIVHHPPSIAPHQRLKRLIKRFLPSRLIEGARRTLNKQINSQFWGWSRDDDFYIRICSHSGMKLSASFQDQYGQSFLVFQMQWIAPTNS